MSALISNVTTFCKKASRDAYAAFVDCPLLVHVTVVIPLVWLAGSVRFNFLFMLLVPLWYLAHVHSAQKARLQSQMRAKLEQDLLRNLDSAGFETVTWLNALIQESWPSWLELYASRKLSRLLECCLAEHKPRAVSKLVVEHLRLGGSPPVVRSAKVYRLTTDDKDATLELDVAFCAAEDMRVELLACLGKGASMGLALEGKIYVDNLRIEGKLRLGFKFVGYYPYVAQLSVGFVTTPVLGLSLRPLSSCSIDISDLPGVATWLQSKSLTAAVEAFLVEPYSYVLDLLAKWGTDFGLNNNPTKPDVEEMKQDLLFWKYWRAETWKQQVEQGVCEINLEELRGGNRHDMWITLQDVKTGELHIAVTVVEPDLANSKERSIPATTVNPAISDLRRKFEQGKAQMGRYSRKHFSRSPLGSQTSSVISIPEDPTLVANQDTLGENCLSMGVSRTFSGSGIPSEKECPSPITIKGRLASEAVTIIQDCDSPFEVRQVSVLLPKDACSEVHGEQEIVPPSIPEENIPKKSNWKKRLLRALCFKSHPKQLCCGIKRRHSETL